MAAHAWRLFGPGRPGHATPAGRSPPPAAAVVEAPARQRQAAARPPRRARRVHADHRVAGDHRAAVEIPAADRRAEPHPAVGGRRPDRAARSGHSRAGAGRQASEIRPRRLRLDRGSRLLQPLGDQHTRHRPGAVAQRRRRRSSRGRQHDHAAARQDELPVAAAHLRPQAAGGADLLLARGMADQAADSRTLSLERVFRRQRLRLEGRRRALLFGAAGEAVGRAGGDAGWHGQGADAARADQPPPPCPRAGRRGDRHDGARPCHHRRAGQGDAAGQRQRRG